jgi:hypothetical protein
MHLWNARSCQVCRSLYHGQLFHNRYGFSAWERVDGRGALRLPALDHLSAQLETWSTEPRTLAVTEFGI